MAGEHEHAVVEAFRKLAAAVPSLPSNAALAAVKEATEELEAALRATGYELPRPAWMGRPRW